MIFNQLKFMINRYEGFHKKIRKKEISVDKEGLAKFYSILFFVLAVPLLVVAIIGFIKPDLFELIYIWIFIAVAMLGVIGILYCNLSNQFIKPLENTAELS
ncbi:MAG: hypothetical protein HZR80_18630 [Candidatus Heimdallarchaeota archaeon]